MAKKNNFKNRQIHLRQTLSEGVEVLVRHSCNKNLTQFDQWIYSNGSNQILKVHEYGGIFSVNILVQLENPGCVYSLIYKYKVICVLCFTLYAYDKYYSQRLYKNRNIVCRPL